MKTNAKHQRKWQESPVVLKCDGLTFMSARGYFEYITRKVGYPDYYKHFEEDVIESDSHFLHVDVFEAGKNLPTLVFLPDMGLYSMCYAQLLYKLGKSGYNIIGLDYRGHGRSEGVRGDFTVPQLMSDVINTVTYAQDRFNGQVSIVGSALGGVLALYCAAIDTRLSSVVCHTIADLAAPETHALAKHPNLVKMLKSLLFKFGNPNSQITVTNYMDELARLKVKYFGTAKNFIETDPLVLKSFSLRSLKSLTTAALPDAIENIRCPVFVVSGTEDHIFPVSYTEKLFNKLTCAKKLQFFQGFNHFMMNEEAETVAPSIVRWLSTIHKKGARKNKNKRLIASKAEKAHE